MAGGSVINQRSQYSPTDEQKYIQKKVMRIVQRELIVYGMGDKLRLPKGFGTTYLGTRFDRLNLPFQSLSEGVPPIGETVPIAQVSGTAVQWGDKVTVTDVVEATIFHSIYQRAIYLVGLQVKETLERNTFNALLAGVTQINYVNSRGSRANLQTGDVINPHEANRLYAQLYNIGVPMFGGPKEDDINIDGTSKPKDEGNYKARPHYIAVMHPFVEQDFRENPQVQTAWSRSDVDKLYGNSLGYYSGIYWFSSNMVPYWVYGAQQSGTGVLSGGSLADGTYYLVVTGSNSQNGYEQTVYSVSAGITITGGGGFGSITFTTPSDTTQVYNAYLSTTNSQSQANLALSPSGPSSGPMMGQAIQLPANTTVTLTGIGAAQTSPAQPGSGLTVYPTYIFGDGAYGQVMLEDPEFYYLRGADKSDPNNQLRVVSWKIFYGTMIQNAQFLARLESVSGFTASFG